MRGRARLEQMLVFLPAAAALGLLLVRLARDVPRKPLFEDEAVTGLVAARPLRELLGIVLADRGAAPLHFVLAHLVLSLDSSADALRWLSVVLALGAGVASFELGRRLGGPVAGAAAAIASATSGLLTVYGSFARMYALLALLGALAAILFVRALELRTGRAALAAALAAWLLPAAHPYGGIAAAAAALVAVVVWRGRPLRPALPAVAVGLCLLLAAVGLVALARERPAVAALTALWLLAPPVLILAVHSGAEPDLSPRHLIYALPLWGAAAGVGAARLLSRARPLAQAAALGLLALAAAFAPAGIRDPRSLTYAAGLSTPSALVEPAHRLRAEVGAGDVLFPFSAVYLAALPEAGRARALPPGEPKLVARAMRRVERSEEHTSELQSRENLVC